MNDRKIIVMLSEGRSGTNGLYRHIFANKKNKPEPYKDIPTKKRELFKKSLVNRMSEFEKAEIIHIKPQHMWSTSFGKLKPSELIDVCIECGIKNFIVITRKNILARLASNPNMGGKHKKQVEISASKLEAKIGKGDKFEQEVIRHIRTKADVKLVTLVYEEDIKNNINTACKKVTTMFKWLPKHYLNYKESKYDTKKLKPCEQNNNLLDSRPLRERISNVSEIEDFLKAKNCLWMLDA